MAGEGSAEQPAVVELRVHGVGGTSPQNLLDHPRPDQVAGDDISGFYRRPDRADLEAYSWGGLTSRSGARAGWLLLLPFALANVAGWLLPHAPGPDPTRSGRVQKAIVRVIALLITAVYVIWIGQVAVDVIAYQCGGQPSCYQTHWWLRMFDLGFFGDGANAARRVAAGMVVPIGVVAVLTYLGKTSRNRYEEQFAHEVDDTDKEADPALLYGLKDDPFWHSSKVVERLTRLHIAMGLVVIAGAASGSLWRLEQSVPGTSGWERIHHGLLLASIAWGVVIIVGVAVLAWVAKVSPKRGIGAAIILPIGAAILVALVAGTALFRTGPNIVLPGEPQVLPGYGRFSIGATLVLMVLVVVLGVMSLVDRQRRQLVKDASPPAGFWGFGPFASATFAGLFLAVVLAGTVVRIADWLGDRAPAADPNATVIEYAAGYDWLAVAMLIVAMFVALSVGIRILLLAYGRHGWRQDRWAREIDAEYQGVATDPRPATCRDPDDEPCHGPERAGMLQTVARMRRIRTALGVADRVVVRFAVIVVLVTVGVFFYRAVVNDWDLLGDLPPLVDELQPLLGPATWLATFLPLLFVGILRQAYRNPTTRRRVGILWDVITFWPRWYHPLSPPSYATRAVPQLTIRLRRLLDTPKGWKQAVVLSAHSQGTVVAAVTVPRLHNLPAPALGRFGLVTHGSPLRRLYGKYFPAYFGKRGLGEVKGYLSDGAGTRWRNLYRLTDPIGGAVFGEAPFDLGPKKWALFRWLKRKFARMFADREHGDPLEPELDLLVADPITDRHAAGDPCPKPLGHSGYFSSPNSCSCPPYDEVLAAMKQRLAARVP